MLWAAILRHNASGRLPIDAVRVGDPPDLPLGSDDPTILVWAESHGRILLTLDSNTMPTHLANHLQIGHASPGVFIISAGYSIAQIVDTLELVAHAAIADDYRDTITYIP